MNVPFNVRQAREETVEELMTKPTLTVEEICQLYGFSPYLIREAVREHDLPAIVIDHHICGIRREDLLAWLERRGGV